jgi:hypothetical protein
MKKYLVLLLFVITAMTTTAQTFNPNEFFSNNTTMDRSTGIFFKHILATKYNTDIQVHHHIAFKYHTFGKQEIDNYYNYIDNNYQTKGFSIVDAMSLIYFFMRNNQIGGNSLSHKANNFIVKDNGKLYVLLVGWSDLQHKWAVCAFEENDKSQLFLLRGFHLASSEIIYAHD